MATDYAEMERDFLAGLEADTGRDLAGWMALIDEQKLAHRNDIIDWLRTQRFPFSWASWLERIHHNGGRPIYATGSDAGLPPAAATETRVSMVAAATAATSPARAVSPEPPQQSEKPAQVPAPNSSLASPMPASPMPAPPRPPEDAGALAELLAKAKAYRMLAEHLIRALRTAIPDLVVVARAGYVSLANPAEFAALAVGPRELRLGLDLGEEAKSDLPRGRMGGTAAAVTHVAVLTDARQVDAALIEAARLADTRVNGRAGGKVGDR